MTTGNRFATEVVTFKDFIYLPSTVITTTTFKTTSTATVVTTVATTTTAESK